MSKRTRDEAMVRARESGAKARRDGLPMSANPYKRDGVWSLYPSWSVGWLQEDQRMASGKPANAELTGAHAGAPETRGRR